MRGVEKKSNSLFGSASYMLRLRQFKIKHPPPFNIFRYWIFPLLPFFAVALFRTLSHFAAVCVCVFFIFFYNPDGSPSYAHSHLHTHIRKHTHIHPLIYLHALPARASLAQSLAKISICRRVANASDINFKKNEN